MWGRSLYTKLRWQVAQALEWRWWRHYLRYRSVATYRTDKRAYWHRILRAVAVSPQPAARSLDAGCGPAGVFMVLTQQRVTAVDPLLRVYSERLAHFDAEEYPWVDFRAQALEVGLAPVKFDEIYCFNAINHVADWVRCLDVLTEVSRPGTVLALGVDVHRHRGLKYLFSSLPGDLLHPQQHTAADYRLAMAQRGWRIEQDTIFKSGMIFDYWLVKATKG